MKSRTNEFKTNDRAKYNSIRRDAIRAMGFCPECSGPLSSIHVVRCRECSIKGKMRWYERTV